MKEELRYTSHESFLLGLKRQLAAVMAAAHFKPEIVTHWHVVREDTKITITLE